jgi:hypothetical protein
VGAPLGNLAEDSSTGDLRRLWRWATVFTGALLRIRGGLFIGNFDSRKGALEMRHLSVWPLCEGNLRRRGDSPLLETLKVM